MRITKCLSGSLYPLQVIDWINCLYKLIYREILLIPIDVKNSHVIAYDIVQFHI